MIVTTREHNGGLVDGCYLEPLKLFAERLEICLGHPSLDGRLCVLRDHHWLETIHLVCQ